MVPKSQTLIPWENGSAQDVSDALKRLLPNYLDDSQYWTGRSSLVLKTLLPPLIYLRDHDKLPTKLNTETFLKYTETLNAFRLAWDLEQDSEIPDQIKKPFIKFLDFCGQWRLQFRTPRTTEMNEDLDNAVKQYVFSVQNLQAGLKTLLERNTEGSPSSQAGLSALPLRI